MRYSADIFDYMPVDVQNHSTRKRVVTYGMIIKLMLKYELKYIAIAAHITCTTNSCNWYNAWMKYIMGKQNCSLGSQWVFVLLNVNANVWHLW